MQAFEARVARGDLPSLAKMPREEWSWSWRCFEELQREEREMEREEGRISIPQDGKQDAIDGGDVSAIQAKSKPLSRTERRLEERQRQKRERKRKSVGDSADASAQGGSMAVTEPFLKRRKKVCVCSSRCARAGWLDSFMMCDVCDIFS